MTAIKIDMSNLDLEILQRLVYQKICNLNVIEKIH